MKLKLLFTLIAILNISVLTAQNNTISSFPYTETFDSGIGDWLQATTDDGDWTLDSNGTPTGGTGPSDDITGGGNYLFIEANNVQTATAILESPYFDLTNYVNANFAFYYHMRGNNNMGTLSFEVSDDDGTSWTELFSLSGEQGNQWNLQNIDISAYDGTVIKLRFVGLTGGGKKSDMAIDQIDLTGDLLETDPPTAPTNLIATNTLDISTDLSWIASTDNVGVSEYDIFQDDLLISTVTETTYQVTGLTPNTTYAFSVIARDFSGNESAPSNIINVTTTDLIPCSGTTISSFTYTETFDAGIGDWIQAIGDDGNWTLNSGETPSGGTGPDDDITGGGNYFYIEANSVQTATAILESPCFDLTNFVNANFAFNYHMRGSNDMGTLILEVSDDDGVNWTELFGISGDQGNQWNLQNVNISTYDGSVIKLRFVGTTGDGKKSDIAIDQIDLTANLVETDPPTAPTNLVALNTIDVSTDLSWDASTDNVGVTGYDVYQDGVVLATVTETTYQVTGLTPNTTYAFSVIAKDFSGNASAPSNTINVTTTDLILCSGTTISSFTYAETFDAGIGDWIQATGDDGNWTLNSGETPSGGTGPDDDITGGGNYFYTEANNNQDPGRNATAILESPCFDLSNYVNANFEFNYHMRGNNDMGTLSLEVSDDDGVNWTELFSLSGEQGNQWNLQNIDISSYDGSVIKLRFIGLTGDGNRSDMAIDQIDLTANLVETEPPTAPNNLVALNTLDVSTDLSWDASTDNVGVTGYDVYQNGVVIATVTETTYQVTGLTPNTTYAFSVIAKDFSGNASAPSNTINVTTTDLILCSGTTISSFTYAETFDAGIGDWIQATGDDGNWTLNSGETPSGGTGPDDDITGGGNYFYTEANNNQDPGRNATAILESPCFDLSNYINSNFAFNYHMRGNNDMGTLSLEVSDDDGVNWTELFSLSGEQGNQWNLQNIDISSYDGSVIKLRFIGLTGDGNRSDMAIDQIDLSANLLETDPPTAPTNLVALNTIDVSTDLSWDASTDNVGVTGYDVYQDGLLISTVTETTYQVTGLTPNTTYAFSVIAKDFSGNESAPSNTLNITTTDSISCTGTVISNFSYTENFDSGIGDWIQATNDDGNWTLDSNGTPSGGTGPDDDITGGGNYFYIEANNVQTATAILESPCFDFTNEVYINFAFYYHMRGNNNMGDLSVEISDDDGANWIQLFSLSGEQGNQWNLQNIDISSYGGSIVKLRFVGTTGNGKKSDMAIDQIQVITQEYCFSNGNDTSDEYIGNVQFNTISNPSGVGISGIGYSDFTSISTALSISSDYTISITPTWTGGASDEGYAVWIDYNIDGDFSDPGELVWSQVPTQTTPVTGNFTIPINAVLGETRMRVSLKNNAIPTECESFDFGEVEDYTIIITYDGLLYSNNIWSPNAPSNTTEGSNALVLDGTYTINSDINLNNLIVNMGANIEVDSGQSLTLAGTIENSGDITLNSNSTQYSSLIVNGNVMGDVIYKRHVNTNPGGNDLIAPPVSGQVFSDFALANPNIVSNVGNTLYLFGPFDKASESYLTYANTETATLDAGIGYRAASTDDSTFTFVGLVNTNSISVPIINSGTIYPEWNLIGNPYPSYIKLTDFMALNNTQFDLPSAGIYGYDGNASDGWTIWNQAYADANPSAIITPGQGFLVAAIPGGGTVNFTPTMRTTGNADDFIEGRQNIPAISYFKLQMNIASDVFKTEFYISDNASLGLDRGYDAGAFGGIAPSTSIYSQLVEDNNGLDLAIQAIHTSDLDNAVRIPLGINAAQGQQLRVNIAESTLPESVNVYLEDSQTNTFTLLNTTDFIVTATTTLNGTGRFFLRFESETPSTSINYLNNLNIYNTNMPKQLFVKGQLNEKTTVTIYDIQRRLMVSRQLDTDRKSQQIDLTNIVTGIYIVELKNTTQSLSKRIIIK